MTEVNNTEIISRKSKVPVFLAWSGNLSEKTAKVLRHYLPLVINAIEPYMSEEDIEKGTRWSSEISSNLETTLCGILCLTPENIGSQWIHFEAGALSKIVSESYVCPLLIGMKASELKDPLSMFQATTSSKDDLFKLIKTLNTASGELGLSESRLTELFDTFWPKINEQLNTIEKEVEKHGKGRPAKADSTQPIRSELIEELVVRSREQSRQLSQINNVMKKDVSKTLPTFTEDYLNERLGVGKLLSRELERLLWEKGVNVVAADFGSDFMAIQLNKPIDQKFQDYLRWSAEVVGFNLKISCPQGPKEEKDTDE